MQVLREGTWFDSEILDVREGTIKAKYHNGGDEEEGIDTATRVRGIPELMQVKVGQRAQVEYEGVWYACRILAVSGDGRTCTVRYADGSDTEADVDVRSRIRGPRIRVKDLRIGQEFRGEVTGLRKFGVMVDIGAEKDALMHISELPTRVDKITDAMQLGQEVDVWINGLQAGRVSVSMMEVSPTAEGSTAGARHTKDLTAFLKVPMDQWHEGTVSSLTNFGAFVKVVLPDGSAADGLVHVSQIASPEKAEGRKRKYVTHPNEVLAEGQKVKVRVIRVDVVARRLNLSMLPPVKRSPMATQDLQVFQAMSSFDWLEGKVERIADFGAFVRVPTPGGGGGSAVGLVHISCIQEGYLEAVKDVLHVGQDVKVRVATVDLAESRMTLTMKGRGSQAF